MIKESRLRVHLLDSYKDPDAIAAIAIRRCYSNDSYEELIEKISPEKRKQLVAQVEASGHTSTLEHQMFTFAVEGLSRIAETQLVRKRVGASYSIRSGRYVNMAEAEYVIPESIKNSSLLPQYREHLESVQKMYKELTDSGIPEEDARFIQPQSLATKLVVSMSGLALMQFLEKRECTRAQWEIRKMATEMHKLAKEVSPVVFDNAGPTCKTQGICWEGKRSCGLWKQIEGATLKIRQKHLFKESAGGDLKFIDE